MLKSILFFTNVAILRHSCFYFWCFGTTGSVRFDFLGRSSQAPTDLVQKGLDEYGQKHLSNPAARLPSTA